MWIWHAREGRIDRSPAEQGGEVDTFVAYGYSGNGECKNNPEMDHVKMHGPIPRGSYTMLTPEDRPGHTGMYSIALVPDAANRMHGRSAFYIHGDKIGQAPGLNSLGCIILPPQARRHIWESGDHRLLVVAD